MRTGWRLSGSIGVAPDRSNFLLGELSNVLLFPACIYLSLKDSGNRMIASMGSSNSFSRTLSQPCPFFVPSPAPAYIAAFFLFNDVLPSI